MIRIAPSGLQDKSLAANKQRHTLVHVSPHPSRLLSQLHRARISLLSDLRPESRHRAVFAPCGWDSTAVRRDLESSHSSRS